MVMVSFKRSLYPKCTIWFPLDLPRSSRYQTFAGCPGHQAMLFMAPFLDSCDTISKHRRHGDRWGNQDEDLSWLESCDLKSASRLTCLPIIIDIALDGFFWCQIKCNYMRLVYECARVRAPPITPRIPESGPVWPESQKKEKEPNRRDVTQGFGNWSAACVSVF